MARIGVNEPNGVSVTQGKKVEHSVVPCRQIFSILGGSDRKINGCSKAMYRNPVRPDPRRNGHGAALEPEAEATRETRFSMIVHFTRPLSAYKSKCETETGSGQAPRLPVCFISCKILHYARKNVLKTSHGTAFVQ